jgi:hypothetical protein
MWNTWYMRRYINTILRSVKTKQIHKMCAHKQFLQCLADVCNMNRKILQQNITKKEQQLIAITGCTLLVHSFVIQHHLTRGLGEHCDNHESSCVLLSLFYVIIFFLSFLHLIQCLLQMSWDLNLFWSHTSFSGMSQLASLSRNVFTFGSPGIKQV